MGVLSNLSEISRIDDYDTFINKMITASDFDCETEWGNMLSLGTDFIPGIGELKMVLEGAGGVKIS